MVGERVGVGGGLSFLKLESIQKVVMRIYMDPLIRKRRIQ